MRFLAMILLAAGIVLGAIYLTKGLGGTTGVPALWCLGGGIAFLLAHLALRRHDDGIDTTHDTGL